jgi:hypothetical protein
VVDGVAVVLHGHLRTTGDLDLVVQLERENVLRAVQALSGLGFRPRPPVDPAALADVESRRRWIREKNLMVFSMWRPARPGFEVDLFVEEPLDFDQAYARSLRVPLEQTEATVVALDDLIALKRRAGRPLDQEDAAVLESLQDAAEPGSDEKTDDRH